MGKRVGLETIKSCCQAVRESGLRLKTFFILGSPGETLATLERTIVFALALKPDYPVFSFMTPFPGTKLWQTATQYGSFEYKTYADLLIASPDPVFVPHGLTKPLRLKKQKEAFRRLYLDTGMIARQLRAVRSLADLGKLMTAFVSFLKL